MYLSRHHWLRSECLVESKVGPMEQDMLLGEAILLGIVI